MTTGERPTSSDERRHNLALWTAALGPPIAWGLQLQIVYALLETVCSTGWHLLLHVITLLLLAGALAAGWLAWRIWRREQFAWPSDRDGGIAGRTRFFAAAGLMSGVIFSTVIVAQWIPALALDPCSGIRL